MTRVSRSVLVVAAAGMLAAAPALSAVAAPHNDDASITGRAGHSCHVKKTKAPKNVILMIGDGMGYNTISAAGLYRAGLAAYQTEGTAGKVREEKASPSAFRWQYWPNTNMTTYAIDGEYDPARAWSEFGYIKIKPTDSSAAGTAMATGQKTYNGAINVDMQKKPLKTIAQRAEEMGKSTGVVSSVPFTHATPAAWVAHNESRNNYHAIGTEMINSDTDVIIGAGHPFFDDSHTKLATPKYQYINQADFERVSQGRTPFTYIENKADFERLAATKSKYAPKRLFGLPQVASTLQQSRAGEGKTALPYTVKRNDVPSLKTMSLAALNVLDKDKDGFFLMIEGGAIDWAGHGNQTTRSIEETLDFNAAVEAVDAWVKKNSNWNDTVLIVTADHETGYITGAGSNPTWTRLSGDAGELPSLQWNSGDHTNQLVPVYFQGRASREWLKAATKTDPVRGSYLDNTDLANVNFALWADARRPGRR